MQRLFHGVSYYPELWPEDEQARDIAEMKAIGIDLVRMGDFAWSALEPDEGRISTDLYRRTMDRLHAAGIGVVLCTPTAAPPVWLTHGHPERCFVDSEGRVMSHGARQHASYDDPVVRSACLRIAEAMGRDLGGHPSLVAWQIDNELKCHVGEDFNPSSVAKWHRWLERRFGTLAALNEAWGTHTWSQHYQRFDQVPAPRTTPFLHNASLSTAYRMFSRESIAEFLDEQAAVLRRHSSVPITHNFSPAFAVNLERMSAQLDFASFDVYASRANWRALVFDHDLFRGAVPGKAHWLIETSVAHNGWLGEHEVVHPPGYLAAEAVASFALGSAAFCYWLWRQPRAGAELPHSAVMSSWFKPGVGHAEVIAVSTARRALEPLLRDSVPAPAEAAITWSDLGRAMIQTEPLGGSRMHAVDYLDSLRRWQALLLDAGVLRDVRFAERNLDGLRLLITPMMPYPDPAFLARVENWVRAGGVWICAPVTGTRAAEHTVPLEAGLGPIDALGGVETVFSFPISGAGASGEAFGRRADLAGWCSALRPADANTRVIGQLHTSLAPGLAFVTERKLGRGSIIVLGATPVGNDGDALLRELVKHAIECAGLTPTLRASLGTLICPRQRESGKRVWIAVNLDGEGGTVELPSAMKDALSGESIAGGKMALPSFGWRAFEEG
ncbi:MAG TPA: beta-galactosidase [Candidatus Didemnitutus sp.]|nr:beta-galactosidase [Candidatus Didemnitutus sp.]